MRRSNVKLPRWSPHDEKLLLKLKGQNDRLPWGEFRDLFNNSNPQQQRSLNAMKIKYKTLIRWSSITAPILSAPTVLPAAAIPPGRSMERPVPILPALAVPPDSRSTQRAPRLLAQNKPPIFPPAFPSPSSPVTSASASSASIPSPSTVPSSLIQNTPLSPRISPNAGHTPASIASTSAGEHRFALEGSQSHGLGLIKWDAAMRRYQDYPENRECSSSIVQLGVNSDRAAPSTLRYPSELIGTKLKVRLL